MLYAVFGRPIAHSLSPVIHSFFAEEEGVSLRYEKRLVPGSLKDALQTFARDGGVGANVTVPCKTEAFELCAELSPEAESAGAANTLSLLPESDPDRPLWRGDNTDGIGLVRDIARSGVDLRGARVLLLGAGGAVRGVLSPLKKAGAEICLCNRTAQKARDLAREFAVAAMPYENLPAAFDIIVNGTSASLSRQIPPVADTVLARARLVYDMVYGAEDTPFIARARRAGATLCADGLGMLVEQAAASYALWRGFCPRTAPVLHRLRRQIAGGTSEAN